jgi:glucose dehydrogenase
VVYALTGIKAALVSEGYTATRDDRANSAFEYSMLQILRSRPGRELWRGRLPAGGQATPMVYIGPDDREYVVITAGGHGALETRYGDYTIAFRLP